MNKKMTRLLTLAALGLAFGAHAQSNGDYRSVASGNFSVPATWERYDSVTATWITPSAKPGSGNNVLVRAGHVVTLDAGSSTHNSKALVIESGATLKSDGLAQRTLRVYGPNYTNNGTVGGGPAQDSITLETAQASGAVTFGGSGTTQVNRLRAYYGVTSTVTFDHNVSVNYRNAGAWTAYYNNSSSSATDNVTFTINAGKTVKLTDSASFHSNSAATANPGGSYTYNINGTLDMSTSGGTSYLVRNSQTATSLVKVNVGGLMKIGSGFSTTNSTPGVANGAVQLNVMAGGVVDASATRKLTMDSTTFVMGSGTAVFKRVVAAVDTTFPISMTAGGYNAVTMNNAGTADTFSVKLQSTFSQSGIDATKLVNTQWTIAESVVGGTNTSLKLAWLTASQASGFSPATVSIYRYANGHWKEYPATVAGSGTLAAPYIASVASVDTMGIFVVGNAGLALTGNQNGITGVNGVNGSISIAPNPVMDHQLHIRLAGLDAGSYNVSVYNMAGQKVAGTAVSHSGSSSAHTIELPATAAGMYQVQVSSGREQMTQRIIVQ